MGDCENNRTPKTTVRRHVDVYEARKYSGDPLEVSESFRVGNEVYDRRGMIVRDNSGTIGVGVTVTYR